VPRLLHLSVCAIGVVGSDSVLVGLPTLCGDVTTSDEKSWRCSAVLLGLLLAHRPCSDDGWSHMALRNISIHSLRFVDLCLDLNS
jgi:hypothetical protein